MNGVKVSYYIDDTLLVAPSQSECTQSVRKVINLLEFFGFTINYEKSCLQPTREISFLGFNIDSRNMTISLSESKVTKIINVCTTLRNLNRASIRQVAEVTGLLVAAFTAVRYLQLFYQSVEACKSTRVSSGASYEELVSITDTAWWDLDWIIENIRAYNGKSF